MKLKDLLKNLSTIDIDNDFVNSLESLYATSLPDVVKLIVSIDKDTIMYDDFSLLRGLSHEEIIDASSDMAVDFIQYGLLPLFDVGDNDYISYDLHEKAWYKFNIVDEIKFSKASTILEYLP